MDDELDDIIDILNNDKTFPKQSLVDYNETKPQNKLNLPPSTQNTHLKEQKEEIKEQKQ